MINDIIFFYALQERLVPRVSLKRKSSMEPLADQDIASFILKRRREPVLDSLEDKRNKSPSWPEIYKSAASTFKQESVDAEDFKAECRPFQYLFYIGNPGLSLIERLREYKNKYSL